MGTFGPNVFDDDSACEALDSLPEEVIEKFTQSFRTVLEKDYIEYEEGQAVLAYSMVVLGLIDDQNIGKRKDKQLDPFYKERLLTVVNKNKDFWSSSDQTAVVGDCVKCLVKLKRPEVSEVSELWHEGGSPEEWVALVDGIINDLSQFFTK
ncbi:hypothetical protein CLIB1444_03S01310 [[Candida] jaroonii]|uniref:Uncharacterized protein n=1 Tax=[Candida] jaroonii TaxID=467808 RepID=A0ACA9Y6E0_9ASCO|nr:hypothetical protein CLIB1444_03S01310 [[Candida] jaroonii]